MVQKRPLDPVLFLFFFLFLEDRIGLRVPDRVLSPSDRSEVQPRKHAYKDEKQSIFIHIERIPYKGRECKSPCIQLFPTNNGQRTTTSITLRVDR